MKIPVGIQNCSLPCPLDPIVYSNRPVRSNTWTTWNIWFNFEVGKKNLTIYEKAGSNN